MTINKAHLIDHLYRNHGFSRDESSATIESLLEIIKHTLESGENLLISGFGKFIVKEKSKRRGRNPETGTDLFLDARRIVTFKCSKNLREKINVEKKKRKKLQGGCGGGGED
jgi:integration host factor subunit alpha